MQNENYSYNNNYTLYSNKKYMSKFYEFSAKSISWKEVKMQDFEWKVVIVVNTASKCWLTPQYEWLETLYKKYKDQGLVILWFPCNQFGGQEPWDEKSISEWCLINYWVTFPMFSKIEVNWENTHPIFKYLKEILPWESGTDIEWNFAKFLVDKRWTPVKRFHPKVTPVEMEEIILNYLQK